MSLKLSVPNVTELKPRIVVVGVGGAGGNAVNNMIASGLKGIEFVVANTDAQALAMSSADRTIQLGANLTEGLGAGSKPEIGEAAAEEAIDEIRMCVSGAHMVFIAAGMGGGTGTGAASVIARAARELGILTVGVVTKPFHFEGNRRMRMAEAGIAELRKNVDTLIVIPNQNLFRIANEKTTFAEAFLMADDVLHSGIACVTDLVIREGLINLDFADVRTVMSGMGTAMMGTGEASGERRAIQAAEQAIQNPLLDDVSLKGARGLLISISSSQGLTLYEVDEAAGRIRQEVDPEANIIVGATFDSELGDRLRVSIVASGLAGAAGEQPAEARFQRGQPMREAFPSEPITVRSPDPEYAALSREEPRFDDFRAEPRPANPQHRAPQLAKAIGRPEPKAKLPETYDAPGDVVIELGPPQLGGRGPGRDDPYRGLGNQLAGGQLAGESRGRAREPFDPKPPVDMKRPMRRMPEVDEFPAIVQRELGAKRQGQPVQAHSTPAHPSADQAAPADKKRQGLFSRLTGFGRETDDSPPQHDGRPNQGAGFDADPRGNSGQRVNKGAGNGSPQSRDPSVWDDVQDQGLDQRQQENQRVQRGRPRQ